MAYENVHEAPATAPAVFAVTSDHHSLDTLLVLATKAPVSRIAGVTAALLASRCTSSGCDARVPFALGARASVYATAHTAMRLPRSAHAAGSSPRAALVDDAAVLYMVAMSIM